MPPTKPTPLAGARVVKGALQSAVQAYTHPDGRRILLVGCVHMAEPEYYRQVLKICTEAEAAGAVVHREGVILDGDGELADATDEERDAFRRQCAALHVVYSDFPDLLNLGWIWRGHDESALSPYPDTWENHDVAALTMVRLLGRDHVTAVAPMAAGYDRCARIKKMAGETSFVFKVWRRQFASEYISPSRRLNRVQRILPWMRRRALKVMARVVCVLTRRPAPADMSWTHPLVYTVREAVAAAQALGARRDVAVVWQPHHLPGIGQFLVRNGFTPGEPDWVTAAHMPELRARSAHSRA